MNFVNPQKLFRILDQLGLGEVVIWILKQNGPMYQGVMTPRCPMHQGVGDSPVFYVPTGELFSVSFNLQAHATAFKATLIQKTV